MTLETPSKTGETFVYDNPQTGESVSVELQSDGFYGMAESFDFTAETASELVEKLTRWGYTVRAA